MFGSGQVVGRRGVHRKVRVMWRSMGLGALFKLTAGFEINEQWITVFGGMIAKK